MPFAATWMELEIIIQCEVGQKKTDIYYNSYEESSLKNDTKELIYKTEINLKISKTNLRLLLLLFSHYVMPTLFATPWTVAYQAPLSMGFPRQEYWRRLSFPSPFACLEAY